METVSIYKFFTWGSRCLLARLQTRLTVDKFSHDHLAFDINLC